MRVLVTGGAGFVGSHLSEKLVEEGNTVLCLDNLMNGNVANIRHLFSRRNFKFINSDIRNKEALSTLMPGVDAVVHLAAQIHVDRSIVEPTMTYDVNVAGTQNILEAARMHDVEKLIYASTSEVYGTAQYAPIDEKHPLSAPHPYGASKIAADRMCHAYNETYGMNIAIVRPFNLYGPKQKDSGYGGAISIFIKRALNNLPPVIFGDGLQTRDYTYVSDIIEAYKLILESNVKFDGPINFGTGKEIRIIDLAERIIKLTGRDLKPVFVHERPGEVRRLIADVSKATKLGWSPKVDIDKGLAMLVDWYKNYRSEEWSKPS
jgi:UDP-glucose 4-epimerase